MNEGKLLQVSDAISCRAISRECATSSTNQILET